MKTVPLADQSGTIPLRASKNPVLGVFRHHCGEISTIHQPKGKKAHLRYILCDKCGCDQASGESYQAKIRANSFNSIEELEASENSAVAEFKVVEPVSEVLTDKLTETVTEKVAPTVELETPSNVVVTVNEQLPVETTAKVAQVTVPATEKINQNNQAKHKPQEQPKPQSIKRISIAALFGGLLGGFLALAL